MNKHSWDILKLLGFIGLMSLIISSALTYGVLTLLPVYFQHAWYVVPLMALFIYKAIVFALKKYTGFPN